MSQKSTLRVIWWQNGFGGSGRGIVELRYGGISLGPWQTSINEIFSSKLKEAWILRFPEILIGYRCAPEGAKFKYATCRPPIVSLCLELEQIRDHFYYTNAPHLYSKSGLGFVLTPSIAKKWGGLHKGFWIFPPFWSSWNSGKTSIIEDRSVFHEILVCGASETKNKVPIGLEIKFCIFGTILSLLAKAINFGPIGITSFVF